MRVLVGWQERMAKMADEMRGVLDVLPMDASGSAAEGEVREPLKDKGKAPVEGIHAQ